MNYNFCLLLLPLPLPTFVPRYLSTQAPGEWFGHLAFAHDLLGALRPSLLVQLGTVSGDSYFGFCQSVVEHGLACLCYSLPLQADDSSPLARYNAAHYSAFSYLLSGPEACGRFRDNSIGLLHVCVNASCAGWLAKLKPGGFLLIDGIADREAEGGAWRLWEQVQNTFPERFAFHHGGGLGVLRKPGGEPLASPLLAALMSGSEESGEYIRRHYLIYGAYLDHILYHDGSERAWTTRLEELRTELRATQHERMILEAELKQSQFERNDARRMSEHVQASWDAARIAGQTREAQLQAEVERLTGLLQSERDVVHSLMHSLSWKVTAPVRSALALLRPRKKA